MSNATLHDNAACGWCGVIAPQLHHATCDRPVTYPRRVYTCPVRMCAHTSLWTVPGCVCACHAGWNEGLEERRQNFGLED